MNCQSWRAQSGLQRSLSLRSWEAELPQLLVMGTAGDSAGLSGYTLHQRPQVELQELIIIIVIIITTRDVHFHQKCKV